MATHCISPKQKQNSVSNFQSQFMSKLKEILMHEYWNKNTTISHPYPVYSTFIKNQISLNLLNKYSLSTVEYEKYLKKSPQHSYCKNQVLFYKKKWKTILFVSAL